MPRKNNGTATEPAPKYTGPALRASVSFELTVSELDDLMDACANLGYARLGMRLAERKKNLQANVRRLEKEAALLAAAPVG